MNPPVLLITAPFDAGVAAALGDAYQVRTFPPAMSGRSLADTLPAGELAAATAVVCELDLVDERTLALAPELRLVVSCRANPVNVDLAACAARGVVVATTPARNADVTADLAFALLLATLRHTGRAERWLRSGGWTGEDVFEPYRRFRGPALAGRTLGVLGAGAVGRRMIRRALAFGMRVLAHDPHLAEGALDVPLVGLDDLLRGSDVLTVHVPLNPSTTGLIGPTELALMKPGGYLVNAGRAAVVEENALVDALRTGHMAGVGLDVFWTEPVPADHPLLAMDNVTVTPHIGGASDDVVAEQSRIAERALQAWRAGRTPEAIAV